LGELAFGELALGERSKTQLLLKFIMLDGENMAVVTSNPAISKRKRSADLLPEHVDLGLRLTVGEDVIQKPFLQSKHGDGHFPEMSPRTEPAPSSSYYPANGPG